VIINIVFLFSLALYCEHAQEIVDKDSLTESEHIERILYDDDLQEKLLSFIEKRIGTPTNEELKNLKAALEAISNGEFPIGPGANLAEAWLKEIESYFIERVPVSNEKIPQNIIKNEKKDASKALVNLNFYTYKAPSINSTIFSDDFWNEKLQKPEKKINAFFKEGLSNNVAFEETKNNESSFDDSKSGSLTSFSIINPTSIKQKLAKLFSGALEKLRIPSSEIVMSKKNERKKSKPSLFHKPLAASSSEFKENDNNGEKIYYFFLFVASLSTAFFISYLLILAVKHLRES